IVGREARPRVVVPLEGQTPGVLARLETDAIDLRAAGAVGRKVQALAVLRPLRLGVDARVVGDAGEAAARQIEHVHIEVAVARGQSERKLLAVRREGGRLVDAGLRRYALALAGLQILHVYRG